MWVRAVKTRSDLVSSPVLAMEVAVHSIPGVHSASINTKASNLISSNV